MDIGKLKLLIEEFSESGLSSLQYKDNEISLKFYKDNKEIINCNKDVMEEIASTAEEDNYYFVTSKYVGIVKTINKSNFRPFVNIGQKINVGDLLCIIEYLNINIEIKSDVSGVISEVCVENKTMVDYGKVLFKIKYI